MNILATEYSPLTNAFDIYLAGCKSPHCPGCCNPETWEFDQGEACNEILLKKLLTKIRTFDSLFAHVMIMGGEPLDQDEEELEQLLRQLSQAGKSIWLFTRYNLDRVPASIKQHCDYIKCGRYEHTQRTEHNVQYGIRLASANQRIYQRGKDFDA